MIKSAAATQKDFRNIFSCDLILSATSCRNKFEIKQKKKVPRRISKLNDKLFFGNFLQEKL